MISTIDTVEGSEQLNRPKVLVAILNWNASEDTLACVKSVQLSDYDNYSILVIDNGSEKSSRDLLQGLCNATVKILPKNVGYTGGNNEALKEVIKSDVSYVWLLNNDALVAQDCLSRLIEVAETDNSIGLLSPVIYFSGSTEIQHCIARYDLQRCSLDSFTDQWKAQQFQDGASQEVALYGTAMLVRVELVRKIGLLDDRFFAYFEDTDYSIRSVQAGYRNAAVMNASVWHKRSEGPRKPHYYYYYVRNDFLMWKKFVGMVLRLKAAWWNVLRTRELIYQVASQPDLVNACLAGIWDGLRGKTGQFDHSRRAPSWFRALMLWRLKLRLP